MNGLLFKKIEFIEQEHYNLKIKIINVFLEERARTIHNL